MNKIKYCFILFVFTATCTINAQNPDLESEAVDIVKSFDARLGDATRQLVDPALPPLDSASKRLNYNITPRTTDVEYLPPKIRPLAMKGDELQKNYDGYAKLGGGFPASLFGKGYYNVTKDKTFNLGLKADHHSANNSQSVENQRFSWTKAGADGTYYFDEGFAVNGNLAYTSDVVHFYGYNDINEEEEEEYSFDRERVKQRFSVFDIGANIFNGERTEADFNYYAGVKMYFMQDNYAARENGFNLLISGTKWFANSHPLAIELETDFSSFRDTAKQNLNNFFLRPSYTYHGERFKAKLGANIASHDDEFSFFPDVEVSAGIVEGIITAYIGAEGSLQKNNFRALSDYNPYIVSRLMVRNTNYFHYYGGVKGNFQGVNYDLQAGYKTTENLALYQLSEANDTIPRFDVLYDSANIFILKASLEAPIFRGFVITGSVAQRFYTLETQERAWHLPAFTLNAGARYTTMEDKLTVKGNFYLENGVPFLNDDEEAENLNALFDISLGVDYFFSEQIGGFIQVNNLANNQRERWRHYPTFGINALIGIIARF
ncbi:MAG TPA: hypothetical protein PKA00_18090 [Saprospiraceae bacterium]|nr:hypothetical protein [Saprospiraceae bacterium]HMQ84829.1 hypothetical protein [Saprospiraceae bacterium]